MVTAAVGCHRSLYIVPKDIGKNEAIGGRGAARMGIKEWAKLEVKHQNWDGEWNEYDMRKQIRLLVYCVQTQSRVRDGTCRGGGDLEWCRSLHSEQYVLLEALMNPNRILSHSQCNSKPCSMVEVKCLLSRWNSWHVKQSGFFSLFSIVFFVWV